MTRFAIALIFAGMSTAAFAAAPADTAATSKPPVSSEATTQSVLPTKKNEVLRGLTDLPIRHRAPAPTSFA